MRDTVSPATRASTADVPSCKPDRPTEATLRYELPRSRHACTSWREAETRQMPRRRGYGGQLLVIKAGVRWPTAVVTGRMAPLIVAGVVGGEDTITAACSSDRRRGQY